MTGAAMKNVIIEGNILRPIAAVEAMIDELIEREGGFVDHPADRGGPTKFGITQGTLSAWIKELELREFWSGSVEDLTLGEAKTIYTKLYYERPKINHLPEPWQPLVFDWAVNSGPATAIKGLQKLLRDHSWSEIAIDGIIGPKTIAAARDVLNFPLVDYLRYRREFCEAICTSDPSQSAFLKGWLNRIDGLEKDLT